MGLVEVLKPAAHDLFKEAVGSFVSRLDPARWTVFTVPVYGGPLIGRRLVKYIGVVGVLGLEPDGSYRLRVLPVNELPLPVDEAVARAALVEAHARPASREHKFMPSPICSSLCATCATSMIVHDRAVLEEAVRRALGDHVYVRVRFGEGADVQEVEVRETKRGAVWRTLSSAEKQRVRLATGVPFTDAVAADGAADRSA